MAVEEQKIERILRHLLSRGKAIMPQSSCPDEETLASYLAGGLPDDAKNRLEAHLSECALCVDTLLAAYKPAEDKEKERVPQTMIDKAMALVPSPATKESFFDLIVRLVQDSVELVSTSGWSIIPVPAAAASVRSTSEAAANSILKVERRMGRFGVAVEVERLETTLCQVAVRVKEDEKPAEGIRVSLLSGGREVASYVVRQGTAVFDRLLPGEYDLAISESRTPVGTIRLKLVS